MMNARKWRVGVAAAAIVLAGSALAGPPMICFPFDNGGAKSLPWSDNPREESGSYDRANLVRDTMDLLKNERGTLARMETLRRAAVYCVHDARLGGELLGRMTAAALDAEASGKATAEAWFNPGFFAGALHQMGVDIGFRPGDAHGVAGYAWLKKAIALDPSDAAMEFAAALETFESGDQLDPTYKAHVRKALAGAAQGSALARSMESNLALGGKKIEELRKEHGVADAGKR